MWSSIFCSGRKSTCVVDIWGVDKAICIFHDDTMLLLPITSQSESELSLGIAKGIIFTITYYAVKLIQSLLCVFRNTSFVST